MTDYRIFSPTADDWERLRDIRLVMLADTPDAFMDSFDDQNEKDDAYWQTFYGRLAQDTTYGSAAETADGKMVSVAFLTCSKKYDNQWVVVSVFTLPDHRGKGLSKRVMEHLLDQFYRDHPHTDVYLHVNGELGPANKLYRSLGFEVVDAWHDCVMGDGEKHSGYEMVLKKK